MLTRCGTGGWRPSALPGAQRSAALASLDEAGDAYRESGRAHCITRAQAASIQVNEGWLVTTPRRRERPLAILVQLPGFGRIVRPVRGK